MRAGLDMEQDIAAGLSAPEPPLGAIEAAAPATLDWRSFEGASFVSALKNQGGLRQLLGVRRDRGPGVPGDDVL